FLPGGGDNLFVERLRLRQRRGLNDGVGVYTSRRDEMDAIGSGAIGPFIRQLIKDLAFVVLEKKLLEGVPFAGRFMRLGREVDSGPRRRESGRQKEEKDVPRKHTCP